MVKKLTIKTTAPIPKYSHTTLLSSLALKIWVVKPTDTYIADERVNDQIVVAIGQKEKARANSPNIKDKMAL